MPTQEKIKPSRSFFLTDLSLRNRSTVLFISLMLSIFGVIFYQELPKDSYPEVKINRIYVGTPYPGNSPIEIENLITRPIEKELNTISDVEEITSATVVDYSTIVVEFPPEMSTQEAVIKTKDAVDRAKSELPTDLDNDPNVFEFDFASLPILNVNLSGNYSIEELKGYAERLEELVERIPEIAKVEIRGVDEREVQVLLDPHKMDAVKVSFRDIENAISEENINISGGDVLDGGLRRSVRVLGQFAEPSGLERIVVKREKGNIVHLGELAEVRFDYPNDKKSYARLDGKPVVSVDIVKRSGENLLLATDKVFREIEKAKLNFPAGLNVSISNDQSSHTRDMVSSLENNIISGVVLVVLVLLFFLGARNALFVGVSIPLSMLLSFCVLAAMGATINMMVLFSLIMALGMLVDNGIVVTENIYRLLEQGKPILVAVRQGVGEVAYAIISSTMTTLAAFFPLLLWPGLIGEFMKYLPLTLIITLSSSLFVALVINPVLIYYFMRIEKIEVKPLSVRTRRQAWLKPLLFLGVGGVIALFLGTQMTFLRVVGNMLLIALGLYFLNLYVLQPFSVYFRKHFLPALEHQYHRLLDHALKGNNPYRYFFSTLGLFFLAFALMGVFTPSVVFFPVNQPRMANVFIEFPIGMDIVQTNDFSKKVENEVMEVLKPYEYMVQSVITKVGEGAGDPQDISANRGEAPNKALVTVSFDEFQFRKEVLTSDLLDKMRERLAGYPGVYIAVEKDQAGPPVGKPISIEILGDDLDGLVRVGERLRAAILRSGIQGIEELKITPQKDKPELSIQVDKEQARRLGLSALMVGGEIRTALFGKEVSKYKKGEDDYEIILRFDEEHRREVSYLLDKEIVFRNQSNGKLVQVPISSVAHAVYGTTYSQVNRKDLKRLITLSSNVLGGYNSTEVNNELRQLLEGIELPPGYTYRFGGEQAKQAEEMSFLSRAFILAVFMIFLIIVTQFNSFTTPFIIMTTVVFSSIGVLMGLVIFQMEFVVIMTMIGLISLAGVVVNNAIVLLDFVSQRRRERQAALPEGEKLSFEEVILSIKEAGRARLRPVLLTAITTVLGLLPLAVGFNLDITGWFSTYDSQFYVGGDNVIFWGPMSWAIIFGLSFATFLTLVIVPVMYWFFSRLSYRFSR